MQLRDRLVCSCCNWRWLNTDQLDDHLTYMARIDYDQEA